MVYSFAYYAVPFEASNGTFSSVEEEILTSSVDMPYIASAAACVFYPLAGIVADVHVGRYKVTTCSLVLTLTLGVVAAIIFLPIRSLKGGERWEPFFAAVFCVFLVVSQAPFLANAVQFGTDQLIDSPSSEVSSFVHWYVWVDLLAQVLPLLFVANKQTLLTEIYSIVFLTVGWVTVVLVFFIKRTSVSAWFVAIPPAKVNPYTTISRVLNFALKHKSPVQRSAFTYWENELPRGIDLGKEKYGGPFTSEEVEDTKSVLQMLWVFVALVPLFVTELAVSPQKLFLQHVGFDINPRSHDDPRYFVIIAFTLIPNTLGLFFVPLHEVVLFPLFGDRMPSMLSKIWLGALSLTASLVSSLLIDAVGHFKDALLVCQFVPSNETLDIDPLVLTIPALFCGLGNMILTVSALEFILSQAPHRLKGMLIGLFYCIRGAFDSWTFFVVIAFARGFPAADAAPVSCCFGYYMVNSVLGFVTLGSLCAAIARYKSRQREDVVNEYQFVEAYYSRRSTRRTADKT